MKCQNLQIHIYKDSKPSFHSYQPRELTVISLRSQPPTLMRGLRACVRILIWVLGILRCVFRAFSYTEHGWISASSTACHFETRVVHVRMLNCADVLTNLFERPSIWKWKQAIFTLIFWSFVSNSKLSPWFCLLITLALKISI